MGDAEDAPLAGLERHWRGGRGVRRRVLGAARDDRTRRHDLRRRPHRDREHRTGDRRGDGDDDRQRQLLRHPRPAMMSIVTVQNTESIPPHSVNLPSTLAIVSGPMALTIVADDLTAACDTGTLFAGQAPVPVTVWPAAPVAAKVTVVACETQ